MKEKTPKATYSMDLFCVDKWDKVHFIPGGLSVVKSEEIIPTMKTFDKLDGSMWTLSSVRVLR